LPPIPAAQPKPAEPKPPSIPSTGTADAHYQRSKDFINKGQYKEALTEINQAVQKSPQNPIFYNTRGYANYLSKNFKQAIADYTEALRLDPNYLNAAHNLALAYKNSGDQANYNIIRQRELDIEKRSKAK
jgi:Flp pilus assembly protein TadD